MMDLLAVVLLNLFGVLFIYVAPSEPGRVALGAILVVFFPGYAMLSALFPRRDGLDGVERIALGFGLSLALVPLFGLALHFSPWSVSLTPIVILLTLWTLLLAGMAWWRRYQVAPSERFWIGGPSVKVLSAWRLRPVDITIKAALVFLALGAIGAVTWKVQSTGPSLSFSEFYILGSRGTVQDYPSALQVGLGQGYNVGIINREGRAVTYTVRAYLGNFVVGSLGPLALRDREQWNGRIRVMPEVEGTRQKLEMRLYRDGSDEAYERVHIFVDVLASTQRGG